MNVLTKLHQDLRNPKCEGFCLESNGDSLIARRINRWSWEVTTETKRGNVNTYAKISTGTVEEWANDMIGADDESSYVAHIPTTHFWTQEQIDKFINSMCPQLCTSSFVGFTLSAEGAETYTVLRHPNQYVWYVNGKAEAYSDVIRKTRAKLAEKFAWEYREI